MTKRRQMVVVGRLDWLVGGVVAPRSDKGEVGAWEEGSARRCVAAPPGPDSRRHGTTTVYDREMRTPLRVRTVRLAAAVAATIVAAGCGGDGLSCVDFDADDPPMVFLDVDVVALSEAVTSLPEGFQNDPPVPAALTVESASEVSAVKSGDWEYDVENGVSVVMVGDLTVSDMTPIYWSLVGECNYSGRTGGPDGEYESILGVTGGRAVNFYIEDGRLTISEYDE